MRTFMKEVKRLLLPAIMMMIALALSQSASAQGEPPKIVRKPGGTLQGSATRRVEPVYPPPAKAARVSGSVVVEVTSERRPDERLLSR
jgi:hypothetical protein